MLKLAIEVENFLAVRRAKLRSDNNITFIIAPNRAGKTQIMLFLYSFFWSLWREKKESRSTLSSITPKLKNVFLIKKLKDLMSWGSNESRFYIVINDKYQYIFRQEKRESKTEDPGADFASFEEIKLSSSPIYLSCGTWRLLQGYMGDKEILRKMAFGFRSHNRFPPRLIHFSL